MAYEAIFKASVWRLRVIICKDFATINAQYEHGGHCDGKIIGKFNIEAKIKTFYV